MLVSTLILSTLTSASYAVAAVIPHDSVTAFPSQLTDIAAKFEPRLAVDEGCIPYPAVDSNGDVSGGLEPSGGQSSGCTTSPGQVYVRQGQYEGECALMYAFFFPKDQNGPGLSAGSHRYDWENVVVWLSQCSAAARINAVSYSNHGGYITEKSPPLAGTHPLVLYSQNPYPLNHSFSPTSTIGDLAPGVMWDQLPAPARDALNTFDFGKANVPLKDASFQANLEKAFFS